MQNYNDSSKISSPTAPARWRAERTAPPPATAEDTSANPPLSLVTTHARGLVDVLLAIADEYPPVKRWDAELYAVVACGTPALSSAPRPDADAAHAKAHLHLTSREIGRLLAVYPRVVIAGLVEGLTEALKPREL